MKLILAILFLTVAGVAHAVDVDESDVSISPSWALPETPFAVDTEVSQQALATSVGVRDADNKCKCELNIPALLGKARGPFAVKLDAQEVKINRLTARIQKLSDELDERFAAYDQEGDKLADLTAKLNAFTGDGCPKGQFQCGGDDGCVSDVLVCDGTADCTNGVDESRCNITAAVGTLWKGAIVYDHCSQRQPKSIALAITKITQLDWFPSRPKVEALLILDRETEGGYSTDSLLLRGVFDFGGRQVVFSAPEEDGLAFRCQFDNFHSDFCTGNIFRESTGLTCAEAILQKQADNQQ